MPVLDLGKSKYDWVWPEPDKWPDVPNDERITFRMKKLSVAERREFENDLDIRGETAHVGKMKSRLYRAVVGWDNVYSRNGDAQEKIAFSLENLDDVIAVNGGQPFPDTPEDDEQEPNGPILSADLINHIQRKNWRADGSLS